MEFFGVVVAVVAVLCLYFWKKSRGLQNLNSESILDLPTCSDLWDTGKTGERYIKDVLEPLTGYKQILSNCYLPKSDGTFTEIDLILLHESLSEGSRKC